METEAILMKYAANRKEGLIPLLQEIQQEQGFLSEEAMTLVARHLQIPVNKVHGVATFYHQFRFVPQGKNLIRICTGTTCQMKGNVNTLKELEKNLKIKQGNTSRDKQYTIETTACTGACESAPVIRINESFYPRTTSEELAQIIRKLKEKSH